MKFNIGCMVKIDDIGPLATMIQPGKHMAMVELDREKFWIGADLLQKMEVV